MIYIN